MLGSVQASHQRQQATKMMPGLDELKNVDGVDFVLGSRCEDPLIFGTVGGIYPRQQHVGCPGTWQSTFDDRTALCRCPCHQQEGDATAS